MAADFAPFPKPPRRRDGVLTGTLVLPAALRFGREFAAVRARVSAEFYKSPGQDDIPDEAEPEPPDDGTRPVLLGEGRKVPTANQLRLAAWLVEHQREVCERVSRLVADWYTEDRDRLAAPNPPMYRDGLPFLPPGGDPAVSDGLVRVGDIYLAPEACEIGLVISVAMHEGQPSGVCVTDFAEYELGDDGLAYVSDD